MTNWVTILDRFSKIVRQDKYSARLDELFYAIAAYADDIIIDVAYDCCKDNNTHHDSIELLIHDLGTEEHRYLFKEVMVAMLEK